MQPYTIFTGVEQFHLDLFEKYWEKYKRELPALPIFLHDEKNQKAAVLNTWIWFSTFNKYKLLKCERTFSHSLVLQLLQKFLCKLQDDHYVHRNPTAYELHFLFAYFLVYELLDYFRINEKQIPFEVNPLEVDYYALSDIALLNEKPLSATLKNMNHLIHNLQDYVVNALLTSADHNVMMHKQFQLLNSMTNDNSYSKQIG